MRPRLFKHRVTADKLSSPSVHRTTIVARFLNRWRSILLLFQTPLPKDRSVMKASYERGINVSQHRDTSDYQKFKLPEAEEGRESSRVRESRVLRDLGFLLLPHQRRIKCSRFAREALTRDWSPSFWWPVSRCRPAECVAISTWADWRRKSGIPTWSPPSLACPPRRRVVRPYAYYRVHNTSRSG